ncbi:MAG: hypothetical protein WA397_17540 [Roseiarcus sp.]
MSELVKIELDGSGVNYVNSRLQQGGTISSLLLKRVGAVDNAYAPLPEGIDHEKSLQFQRGGLTTQTLTMKWVIDTVAKKFGSGSDFCLLLEDPWAKLTDPSIYDQRNRVLTYQESVIYALPGEKVDSEGLRQLLKSVTSFDYNGFVVARRLPNASGFLLKLDDDTVNDLIKHIYLVFVSAFDREGVVISKVEDRVL